MRDGELRFGAGLLVRQRCWEDVVFRQIRIHVTPWNNGERVESSLADNTDPNTWFVCGSAGIQTGKRRAVVDQRIVGFFLIQQREGCVVVALLPLAGKE